VNQFKNLKVWQRSKDLALQIYDSTIGFPISEKYSLVNQMRKSAVSVPSNIAEGAGRSSKGDFKRFIRIAMGSSYELETQLIIASELGFLTGKDAFETLNELNEIQKMLTGLEKSLDQ